MENPFALLSDLEAADAEEAAATLPNIASAPKTRPPWTVVNLNFALRQINEQVHLGRLPLKLATFDWKDDSEGASETSSKAEIAEELEGIAPYVPFSDILGRYPTVASPKQKRQRKKQGKGAALPSTDAPPPKAIDHSSVAAADLVDDNRRLVERIRQLENFILSKGFMAPLPIVHIPIPFDEKPPEGSDRRKRIPHAVRSIYAMNLSILSRFMLFV